MKPSGRGPAWIRWALLSLPIVAATALVVVRNGGAPAVPARSAIESRTVAIDLREHDGIASLHAFALPGPRYRIDPSKLSFQARPFAEPAAALVPVEATIGSPVYVPPEGSPATGRLVEYAMPVVFWPSQPPGMYRVTLNAAPGFATSSDGAALGYGDWSRGGETLSFNLWWPDTRGADAALQRVRHRLAGRDVYGYGGIDVGCDRLHAIRGANVPIRVRDIVRDAGSVARLWTGSTAHWGNDAAPNFFALGPLRVVVDVPCSQLELADFQIDTTLSLQAPPKDVQAGDAPFSPLERGMSRAAVAWRRGYPNALETRAQLDRQDVWKYFDGPGDGYSVIFRNGRVASFTRPSGLP